MHQINPLCFHYAYQPWKKTRKQAVVESQIKGCSPEVRWTFILIRRFVMIIFLNPVAFLGGKSAWRHEKIIELSKHAGFAMKSLVHLHRFMYIDMYIYVSTCKKKKWNFTWLPVILKCMVYFTKEKKNPTFRITGQNWMTYDVTVIVKGLVVYNIVTCTCTCTCKNIVLLN